MQPNEGIELLYTRDCRAWPEALQNLKTVLKELGVADEPSVIAIDTLDEARAHNFFASPTIHINGVDIDPKARRVKRRGVGAGRPYFTDGRSYAVPPTSLIREAMAEFGLSGQPL